MVSNKLTENCLIKLLGFLTKSTVSHLHLDC